MICPKCQTKGKIKDRYCEKCGTKLQLELPKISKKSITIIFSILLVLGGLLIAYFIGDYYTSPSYIATQYFKSVIHNDVHSIYQTIGVNDSKFVSEKLLQQKIEIFENVDTYYIISTERKGREAVVTFEYYLENDPKTYQASVHLYKNHAKKFGLYGSWKVDSASLAENILFEMPAGSKITIDEVDLTEFQNLEQSDKSYDIYQVPKMIAGTYQMKVTLPIGTVIEEKIIVEDGKRFTIGDFELSDENREKLETTALQTLQTLYDGALQNLAFDTIKENLAIKSSTQIGKRYRNLKTSLQSQNVTFTNIRIASIEVISSYYNKNGQFTTTLEMIHHDAYTYEKNGEAITAEKNDRISKITMIWDDELQIVDLEWK